MLLCLCGCSLWHQLTIFVIRVLALGANPCASSRLCCTGYKKKGDSGKTPDNKETGTTSAAVFFHGTNRFAALAPNVLIETKYGRANDECAKATALSVSSFPEV